MTQSQRLAAQLADLKRAEAGAFKIAPPPQWDAAKGKVTYQAMTKGDGKVSFSNAKCLAAADRCEVETTAAEEAWTTWRAAAWRAAECWRAAEGWRAAWAAWAAADGWRAAGANPDAYLVLSASLALETLRELNSPGCKLLEASK